MTVLLRQIPGFYANPPRRPAEPEQDVMVKLLGCHVGKDTVRRMLERGTLVLIRGYENFPEAVRASAAAAWPRPSCVFDKNTGKIYANTAGINSLELEADFLVCAGILALGELPIVHRILQKAAAHVDKASPSAFAKTPERARRAALRYALNSRVWNRQMRGAAFLTEIASDMNELFSNKAFLAAKKIIQTGEGRFTAHNFAALLYILTQFAAGRDAGSLAKTGVELFDAKALEGRELPLDAICRLSKDAPPEGKDFFGRSMTARQALEHATGGYLYPDESMQLLMEDWTPGSRVFFEPAPGPANPLSALSIRPFAQLSLQCLTPEGKAPVAQLLAAAAIDPLEGECTELAALPAVQCARKTAVRIVQADVWENLAFATLWLIAPDLQAGPIPAIATSWPMQADRLKSERLYEADFSFWASRMEKSADRTCWLEQESDFTAARPRIRFRGEVLSVEQEEPLAGIELVRLEVSLAPEKGRKIEVVLPRQAFEGAGAARGDFAELTGFFLAGRFTSLDKKRQVRSQPSRKELLAMAAPDLRVIMKKFSVDPLSDRYLLLCQDVFIDNGFGRYYRDIVDLAISAGSPDLAKRAALCGLLAEAKEGGSQALMYECALHAAEMLSGTRDEGLVYLLTDSEAMSGMFGRDIQRELRAAVPMRRESMKDYCVDSMTEAVWMVSPAADRTLCDLEYTNIMLHAVNAGMWSLGCELARRYALGIGSDKNPARAERVLSFISDKGNRETSFAPRAFQRMGEKLYTLQPDEVLAECKKDIENGNYGSILLTALWYASHAKGGEDLRIAYGLLRSIEKKLGEKLISRLCESIRTELGVSTAAQRRALDAFDPWAAIGIEKPDLQCSLYRTLHVDESVRDLHADLYAMLDPNYQGRMTERIMRQLEFVSQGEEPAFEQVLRKAGIEESALRLTEVPGCAGEGGGEGRLLLAYLPTDEGWLMREAYPVFESGVSVPLRLMSGFASTDAVSMVLLASYVIPSTGESVLLSLFDPLWPLYATQYDLGDEREFMLYGVGRALEVLPAGTLKAVNLTTRGEIRRLAGNSLEQALHTIVSPVRGVHRRVAEIAGVAYARLEVMPFFEMKAGTMPVYLPDALVPDELKPGDEVKIEMQLNGYTLAEPLETGESGNA